mgnify:CR=1 FL=1
MPGEPRPETLTNPVARAFLATRPAFLMASALPVVLGAAAARGEGALDTFLLLAVLLGAVLIHGGINSLNDYHDALTGADAVNEDRIHPFTGGSRFIQNEVLRPQAMARLGRGLLVAGAAIGVYLAIRTGPGLLALGLGGLVLGWAYSARPLQLMARGWGEPAVFVGFGGLIPLGADWVLRGTLEPAVLAAGVPFGLLVMDLLFVNEFPDRRADSTAGKRHWVVRLGPHRARWIYGIVALGAYLWVLVAVVRGALPVPALVALAPSVLSFRAWAGVMNHADEPAYLEPAIRRSVSAMAVFGVLMTLALWWSGGLR